MNHQHDSLSRVAHLAQKKQRGITKNRYISVTTVVNNLHQ